MKNLVFLVIFIAAALFSQPVAAQQSAWIQIEAHPTLQAGQVRARAYSSAFSDVNGFRMRSGWYAVALGPYSANDAERRLQSMINDNLIPRDSYIAYSNGFSQQFWPIGANTLNAAPIAPSTGTNTQTVTAEPQPAAFQDETPRQARASEGLLNRQERELLQIALQAEGFYNSAIDGAFGRGTRGAMSAWQDAMGYEATGVLTSLQRNDLLTAYNSILEGTGLAPVSDQEAGIEVMLPTEMVSFARFEPPFVHYDSTGAEGVRVLLISQTGTQATLFGLYDILQTLEIVPLEGERSRTSGSFVLTGQNSEINSYTYAALNDGLIKGFTLVWPAGDTRRMNRVIQEMRSSFTAYGDALDETLGAPSADQRIDLLAGLDIRQPDLSRSGFYIDASGTVVTTMEAVNQCQEITLNHDQAAEIVFTDATLGIAVLRPTEALAPVSYAHFLDGFARLQSEIAVAGYPYEGVLNAPTLTYGQLSDIRGLGGEPELLRLALSPQSGDAGGPVFDSAGQVLGMLLEHTNPAGQQLPDGVSFSLNAQSIRDIVEANGISATLMTSAAQIPPEELTTLASDMTVLVSCWN